jgi:hypothetical protein
LRYRLAWIDLGAWVITTAEVVPRLRDSAFEPWLAAIAVVGVAGAVAWLRKWRRWRGLVAGAAALYLVFYVVRMYWLEVEPLLAIVSLPQAVADAFYVVWSSPMGRLSRGEVLDALAELWRECFMPLVQLGVLAVALSRRR